jgi:DNA-binding NarL/FixJ family response regulator
LPWTPAALPALIGRPVSGDDLHLLPCCQLTSLRTAFVQNSARAVHASGVRAQAPINNGDSLPRAGPGGHAPLPDPLTGRELVVLQLLPGSLSRREIAAELGRSPNTVKTQTQAIYVSSASLPAAPPSPGD